jgi:hypothetical protein
VGWNIKKKETIVITPLPEEKSPERAAFAHAHLLGVLLTLRNGVHDSVHPVTKAGDLNIQIISFAKSFMVPYNNNKYK